MLVPITVLLFPLTALALPNDVPSDTWFSETVTNFTRAGHIDETQPFRPTEKATRAEFVQLIVKLQGGITGKNFTTQSFDDVNINNPFYEYFESAGQAGWLKGGSSCYGTHPCFANPNEPINRAEASTLMIRAFNLQMNGERPNFDDNPQGQWFTDLINAAASLCILQGDAGSRRVRPSDNMLRAEMVIMLERALQNLRYPSCSSDENASIQLNTQEQNRGTNIKENCTTEDWICGDFGMCINGLKEKECRLINYNCLSPESVRPISAERCNSQESIRTQRLCTVADWSCSPWGQCEYEKQKRICNLVSFDCEVGQSQPEGTQPCDPQDSPLVIRIKKNLSDWQKFHESIIERARSYQNQPEAYSGLIVLGQIEDQLLGRFNFLVEYQNDPNYSLEGLIKMEEEVEALKAQFNALPLIYY